MFTSFKNCLNERALEKLNYGCLMLSTDIVNWNKKISIIQKEDVYEKDDDYGYEKNPHVTILYGIHDNEIDKKKFFKKVETLKPITSTISKIGIFENEDYDVVKFDVHVSKELKNYRNTFKKAYPNTQTFTVYHPHITIAYVKKGEGKKYVQKIEPFDVIFNTVVYSFKNNNKKIKLN